MLDSSLFIFYTFLTFVFSQTCLNNPRQVGHTTTQSPDDTLWTSSGSNRYSTTLTLNACYFDISPGNIRNFWTRCWQGSIPGPTLRMERGNIYELTVVNALGPENTANDRLRENSLRNPNHTNIHTHGLHISGEEGGDYIFEDIAPGNSKTFTYYIPCDHAGGTFWYHPHVHGSTAIQAGGGANGMLIMEEDGTVEGLPDWVTDMTEILLAIYFVDLVELDGLFPDGGADDLFRYDGSGNTAFHLVNGEYQPTICLNSNEWTRFRISYAQITDNMGIFLDGCDLQLLAKDGVWIYGDIPRSVSHLFFTQGSRVDVAVYCPASNNFYEMTTSDDETIAFISVSGSDTSPTSPQTTLTSFQPNRPEYLPDLLSATPDATETISVGRRQIMGVRFQGANEHLFEVNINDIVEFDISSERPNGDHPYHMHVNHVQLISGGAGLSGDKIPSNWNTPGDYLDVVMTDSIVRWVADTYGGTTNMHCHILRHEDEGAMGTFNIIGGCDAKDEAIHSGFPCEIRTCD